jgi:hypothetical protein
MKKPVYWMVAIMTADQDTLAQRFVTVAKTLTVRLEFTLAKEGEYQLRLHVDCDSYMGLTQFINLGKFYVDN